MIITLSRIDELDYTQIKLIDNFYNYVLKITEKKYGLVVYKKKYNNIYKYNIILGKKFNLFFP